MEEFLDEFRKGLAVISLKRGPNFTEDAEIVGEYLDGNFELVPYDCDGFGKYFLSVANSWSFVFAKPEQGYCPACNSGYEGMKRVQDRFTLDELRAMIEKQNNECLETAFEEVFV